MKARLVKFRLFRARDIYEGAPAVVEEGSFSFREVEVLVTIGKPNRLQEAYISRPKVIAAANPKSIDSGDAKPPEAWRPENDVFTCIEAAQEIDVEPFENSISAEFLWYKPDLVDKTVPGFRRKAQSALDSLTALLLHRIGRTYLSEHMHDSETYIERLGQNPHAIVEWRFGRPRLLELRSAEDLPSDQLAEITNQDVQRYSSAEAIGRWVNLAMSEADDFKRLMWAFAGLDVLCGKAFNLVKEEVTQGLRYRAGDDDEPLAGFVVQNLVWPTAVINDPDPGREPDRGLAFRFAVMAVGLSPSTANEDMALFREVQSHRNRIHGRQIDPEVTGQRAKAAFDLLMHYAPIVLARWP